MLSRLTVCGHGVPWSQTMRKQLVNQSERLLSRKGLAERWNLSQKTLIRYEKAGKLRPLSLSSNVVRYRLSDIEKLELDATSK